MPDHDLERHATGSEWGPAASVSRVADGRRVSTPSRVAAVLVVVSITFHWVPSYWVHTLRPILTPLSQYGYYVSMVGLGILLTVWSPLASGLRLAETRKRWRTVAVFTVGMVGTATGVMLFLKTPFYQQSAAMYLTVPLYEELLFRGFLFAVIVAAFPASFRAGRIQVSVATLVTGVAFGLWHLGGVRLPEDGFFWFQVFYTTVAGMMLGYSRDRTGSLWSGFVIHFVVNWWAVCVPGFWAE